MHFIVAMLDCEHVVVCRGWITCPMDHCTPATSKLCGCREILVHLKYGNLIPRALNLRPQHLRSFSWRQLQTIHANCSGKPPSIMYIKIYCFHNHHVANHWLQRLWMFRRGWTIGGPLFAGTLLHQQVHTAGVCNGYFLVIWQFLVLDTGCGDKHLRNLTPSKVLHLWSGRRLGALRVGNSFMQQPVVGWGKSGANLGVQVHYGDGQVRSSLAGDEFRNVCVVFLESGVEGGNR